MNRRRFIENLTTLGAIAATDYALGDIAHATQTNPPPPPPLKQLAAECDLRVGAAISKGRLQGISGFSNFFISNFDLLTPESEMKWSALHPTPDRYDFSNADFIVNFAQANGIGIHGHNLCWNAGNPGWLDTILSKNNAKRILQDHIKTVMTHFKGQMESWDVVNEPIGTWFKRPDGLYAGPWLENLGPEYIDVAFYTAFEIDPVPLRILNIHNVEHADQDGDAARRAAIELTTRLLKNNVPIQAIGIESHLDAWRPINQSSITAFVKELRDLGLKVLITEFDVNDSKVLGNISVRDQAVANYYGMYISDFYAAAGTPNRLTLWSPVDRGNWMDSMQNFQRWKREDGNSHRPGILDDDMNFKPSYFALVAAIQRICHT